MVHIERITNTDAIPTIVASVIPEQWDVANEMEPYDESALREYLSHDDNILLVAYDSDEIVGLLLATKVYLPYKSSHWMYVDELDTKPSHRRQGIGRALMERIFEITRRSGMKEVYLGTEMDNVGAQKFYESLHPIESEQFIGYTFKIDSGNI
jgi:ribosomal protein S18 acetylase RimI-like enzyme